VVLQRLGQAHEIPNCEDMVLHENVELVFRADRGVLQKGCLQECCLGGTNIVDKTHGHQPLVIHNHHLLRAEKLHRSA